MEPQFEPWSQTPPPQPYPQGYGQMPHMPNPRWRTAAIWLWSLGGIMLLLSMCCCAPITAVFAAMPPGDFNQAMQDMQRDMPAEDREAFNQLNMSQSGMATAFGAFGVCTLLGPGAVLLICGFLVNKGSSVGRIMSLIVLGVLELVFVLFVLLSLFALFVDPISGIMNLVVCVPIALVVLGAAIAVIRSWNQPASMAYQPYADPNHSGPPQL